MHELFLNSGEIFLHVLNISITASWLVIAVLFVRLLLKKSPKWVTCVLWSLVALRLLLPINIESPLSLVPSGETIPVSEIYATSRAEEVQVFAPQIDSGIEVVDSALQPIITETSSQPVLQSNVGVVACVWLVGVFAMLVYSFISFLRVKRSTAQSIRLKENIYLCDNVSTPFILGIIRPKIYLPSSLYQEDVLYVIDHEKSHIKRLDHLWKPLGFIVLSVYWFNPVMWIGYIFLCKDIELACDEKTIKDFDCNRRKEYSNALINCSSQRRLVSACPLAFGETGVKNRIKSVLSYKKPAFWVVLVSLLLCVIISVGFLTSPVGSVKAIIDEKGYNIISQQDVAIYLSVPVDVLNDEINSEKGQFFSKNEVKVFDSDSSNHSFCPTDIYLTNVRKYDERVHLCFRFGYESLPDCGVIYSGYKTVGGKNTHSVDVRDINSLTIDGEYYSGNEVVYTTGLGPNDGGEAEFVISISEEAFYKAKKEILFDIFCTKTAYEKKSLFSGLDEEMTEAIEEGILVNEGYERKYKEDNFSCASFIPLKIQKKQEEIKIFAIVQSTEFDLFEGKAEAVAVRGASPVVLTIAEDGDGYHLKEYVPWLLSENKNEFPENLEEIAANAIGYYYDVLHEKNLVKAQRYFAWENKEYTGTYVYYGSREPVKPTLTLKENGEAIFSFSVYSSYMAAGTYNIEGGVLTLVTDDNSKVYTFNVTDKGFQFDAHNSSELPTYKVSSSVNERYSPVPDKAVLIAESSVGQNSYFNGTILQVSEGSLLIEPFPDEAVCKSANKLSVPADAWVYSVKPRVGDKVVVCYDGMIQETFPAQINGAIGVYVLETEQPGNAVDYQLGSEGVDYVEVFSHLTDNETGEISEHTLKITDREKIQLFIKKFNSVLEASSVDELDIAAYPDNAFEDFVLVNVHAADGSFITVSFVGAERIRLGKNTRRMITSYEREMLLETLYDSRQREIDGIITGTDGRVDLTDDEFLNKAYTLTNDMSYKELCDVFGKPPFVSNASGFETYYYFNGEYVLFVEKDIRICLRKISDKDYRHTIG